MDNGNGKANGKAASNGATKKRPVGRPRSLTPAKRKELLRCFELGMGRDQATRFIGSSRATLLREMERSEKFRTEVIAAEAKCEEYHLNKIAKADSWKASAWFLARRWPDRWGSKSREDVKDDGDKMNEQQRAEAISKLREQIIGTRTN